MGDSPVVAPPNHDTGPSQVSTQNALQNLGNELQGDNSKKASNRPPNLISSSANYNSNQIHPQNLAHGTSESFNMANIGAALPDMSYQNYGQRFSHNPGAPAFMYQMPNVPPQFVTQGVMSPPPTASQYPTQYQPQYHMYANQQMSQPNMHFAANNNHFYANHGYGGQQQQQQLQQQANPQYYVQPNSFGQQGQVYMGNQMGMPYQPRGNFPGENQILSQQRSNVLNGPVLGQPGGPASSIASSPSQSSVVRGPPRKPRQSGHAIWIGNLPPQTDLMSLVIHVCKETPGLESLFLISKSNCAFANFKDEPACIAAQTKIHDSRFQTVRLVSRLRKASVGTVSGVSVPTGPAALTPPQLSQISSPASNIGTPSGEAETEDKTQQEASATTESKDKFFVVKSLTVEDLEQSVRNGIWATQTHNEEALNKAYQTADNVYLIFSANKSGEYFGYARMISQINEDPAAAIEFAPKAQTVEDPDLPKAIPTPASEFTPKGRIIDDSARGTIFWEAEREDMEETEGEEELRSTKSDHDSETPSKAWGKPFKIEWVSTTRLPFYRTRGLRNPWNSNREVKIARDGTELETSIGKRLVGLFHRVPSPVAPQMQGLPMPIMQVGVGNHPQAQMRPFQ